jgi:hypothetical protein
MNKEKENKDGELYENIDMFMELKNQIRRIWGLSTFRKLLIKNLESDKPVFQPPSEDFPRLRNYRGIGPSVNIRDYFLFKDEKIVELTIEMEYVSSEVSRIEESEGSPGAPTVESAKTARIPLDVLQNPLEKFDAWAKAERINQQQAEVAAAKVKILEIAQRTGLKVKFA